MRTFDLSTLIAQGENLHVEFKQWPVQPDDLAAAIVAFANTDGGQLLLGVDDHGQVIGITESDFNHVAQTVDNVAFHNIHPPATVVLETTTDSQGRVVLLAQIPKGSQRPYRTNRGVYYIRTASGRRQASREELLRLFQASESPYYDETPVLSTSQTDIQATGHEPTFRQEGNEFVLGLPRKAR